MVFNLATRLPFRHRGIARSVLARWSGAADQHRTRSHLINCDDGGPAEVLYRRLGFTDEVYWYRRYRASPWPASTSPN
jgi:GNAT superfamily N-acetyltransferase